MYAFLEDTQGNFTFSNQHPHTQSQRVDGDDLTQSQ